MQEDADQLMLATGKLPQGGGALEKISIGMLVLLFLGLKFDNLLFFGVAQNEGQFWGLKN